MLASALLLIVVTQDPSNLDHTVVKPASKEPELAQPRITLAQGLGVALFAAEPLLANPVAFTIDERGRVFVAETYRIKKGVFDMRDHRSWLDDDLACRTVEQRVAQIKQHVKDWRSFGTWHEQIRLLEDKDGDGRADASSIFADGFNDVASGIGAGLLARDGNLYYTCIPDLWRLCEAPAGGAPARVAMSSGYGVHNSFFGHDLHGLRIGPDRKLYFSIGDRGLHVVTDHGVLDNPDCGAVLRCELDGSELEIYATGLRNPQELAFDDRGNLFTGDNNGDGGDKARLVHVVAGGDSGWRIGPQWIDDRGPWNRERLWHLAHRDQPAWIVPPIAHLCNGPSGFTHYPGTGLPDRYADSFFLVDFSGTPAQSGVYALRLQPNGASFELAHLERFAWGVLATDCEFGPDGGLWVLDWVESWEGSGKGRIWRIASAEAQKGPLVAATRELLRSRLAERPLAELLVLLGHRDQRVRMEAHFALADKGKEALAPLAAVAGDQDRGIARLHAIWGLMLMARGEPLAAKELAKLLDDSEFEVRAQAARALGERRCASAAEQLKKRLADPSLRVRMLAAEALGRIADRQATDALCRVLHENADRDPFLRHAASLALSRCADRETLVARIGDESPPVRMGVLLALRHQKAPELAQFLSDPEPRLVVEAARAIHDLPIDEAMPQLAALVARPGLTDRALVDRAINAALRIGTPRELLALLELAGKNGAAEGARVEALWAVEHFEKPGRRDRVLGDVRPLQDRDLAPTRKAVAGALERLADDGAEAVAEAAIRAGGTLVSAGPVSGGLGKKLAGIAQDQRRSGRLRTAALDVLDGTKHEGFEKILRKLTTDSDPSVRAAVLEKLGKRDPAGTVPMLETALRVGALRERQKAFATLAKIEAREADAVLRVELDRTIAGRGEPELELDLYEAIGKRKDKSLAQGLAAWLAQRDPADPVAQMHEVLRGGSREAGERIFKNKAEAQCTKCHRIGGDAQVAGPDLKGVGKRLSREKLLESLLVPSKVVAEGFGTVAVELKDSRVIKGVLKAETATELELVEENGTRTKIPKDDIETRADPVSAMTPMGSVLSKHELRDVVEFLASLDE